jgi:hypothetical protein
VGGGSVDAARRASILNSTPLASPISGFCRTTATPRADRPRDATLFGFYGGLSAFVQQINKATGGRSGASSIAANLGPNAVSWAFVLGGGFRSSPGILDAATLELVTRLSGIPAGDEFAYIAMMPVPEPSELAAVGALLALLAVRLSRPYP